MQKENSYSSQALSAIFSNLEKACKKQFRDQEASYCRELANYFATQKNSSNSEALVFDTNSYYGTAAYQNSVQEELNLLYPQAEAAALATSNRGALRALTWGKKVTAIQKSLLQRYQKQKETLLTAPNTFFMCEACGFITVAPEAPALCPICKAPQSRFSRLD